MNEMLSPHQGFTQGHLNDEFFAEAADSRGLAQESQKAATMAPEHAEHLARCSQCRAALEATERIIDALRAPAAVEQAPPELWDRIAADIADDGEAPLASVHQLRPRQQPRRTPWWGLLATAAAGAVIGGAAIAGILSQETTEDEPPAASPTALGEATLEPVADDELSGSAEMVESADGDLVLTIEVSNAPDAGEGYFEVWLRDEDASRLISLGAVTEGSSTVQVPAGIDLNDFPVVDVSHEHFDGDPGHGGITLAAGAMEVTDD